MGANYSTILIPAAETDKAIAAIGEALRRHGFSVFHREERETAQAEFSYNSDQMVFLGPPNDCRWMPLVAAGAGLPGSVEDWYRENPLAASLSQNVKPVVHLFSYDSGYVAGYSIFEGGDHWEAQSVAWCRDANLADLTSPIAPPNPPTLLGSLLQQVDFDYELFVRGFANLEVATAALAARFGLTAHLLDPYEIADGDGGLAVVNGDYRAVELAGWKTVYYV